MRKYKFDYRWILLIFLMVSCQDIFKLPENQNNKQNKDPSPTDIDIDKLEEGRDRTIWQKPYEVIHLMGSLEGKVIADIGAGSGYFSFRFVNEADKVIAIDIEPELILMMDQEKKYYKPELQNKFEARLATSDDPKLNDSEVDIVFISNTYTLIPNRIAYLKRLKNKFKPFGRIMIIDFKKKLTPIGPMQKNRLAQSEVELELIEAGYDLELSDDRKLEYQYIIVAQPNNLK